MERTEVSPEEASEGGWQVVESKSSRRKRMQEQTPSQTHGARYGKNRKKRNRKSDSAPNKGQKDSFNTARPIEPVPPKSRRSHHKHIYSPLQWEQHDIRILVLKAGKWQMPLKGDLLQRPLAWAEKTGFETISYCWGEPNDQGTININGYPLGIPNSAIEALRQFRYEDKDRLLWIDSICLNQSDVKERGHEVARMHHIYSRGRKNLV
ncbi:Hypothetical predicted protein [Lecanosticta acicola]|uniref:Heterokaryon incompatibility domain-containing protein n=1 Tax=Lecanosticta acicola TaxID=111012 RepID=A0AAI8Z840_9PEZI|nr:Hypothetical predicted protein [Lecanosticta acicola]